MHEHVDDRETVILGVDPGFSAGGAAILSQRTGEQVKAERVVVLKSEKSDAAKRKKLRVSVDDHDRVLHLLSYIEELFNIYPINAVSVENFTVGARGRGKGEVNAAGWKVALFYGALMGFCRSRRCPLFIFTPGDVKRAFHLQQKTSKADVRETLAQKVRYFDEYVGAIAKTYREHVGDAVGLAFLGFERVFEIRHLGG